ncbi:DUF2283 domain-containing protein [Sulfurirhabdus autotrophica]|uniref:Uncharacterized protein YuzE n=1 Tax=Sulfurirhabdus autotrophica TaxID=1706046 RepID=A0A4R3YCZ7_9PROT|nr:DUF2283 domain-containing protein [Sulfurirhabdus autotrophica]TCV88968.1 uncharacterized protein YuzE [Sulfurirhabdus autotrophica]
MNIVYFEETDSLYIELVPQEATGAWEAAPGVIINYGADGQPVGIEIDQASEKANLDSLKIGNFPGLVENITKRDLTH